MSKKFISVLVSLTMLMSLFPLSIVFATNNSEILVGINTPFAPFEKKVNGEYVGYDIGNVKICAVEKSPKSEIYVISNLFF